MNLPDWMRHAPDVLHFGQVDRRFIHSDHHLGTYVLVPASPGNPLVRLINAIVEPILLPIRAVIPPIGGFSFDAMIAILLLSLIKNIFLRAAS